MTKTYQNVEDPHLYHLKALQSMRIRGTYDDFASQKKYAPACFFFFNRLYSTEDTTDRDASFRRIHKNVKTYLGGDVAHSMERLIELQEITERMDQTLVNLLHQNNADLPIAMDLYEHHYRQSDNYALREKQIELLEFTMRLVHNISHRFGIGMVLRGLRAACLVTGDTRMIDFLWDGYQAFANLRNIDPLASAMIFRETERLNRIYGREFSQEW